MKSNTTDILYAMISSASTAQKIEFSIENFFSECDQIVMKLRIWLHLLKKSLMENSIFCVVQVVND